MLLRVENNNKFVRGKSKVRASIEDYLRHYYQLDQILSKDSDYVFYVPYTSVDELEKIVYDIIDEMVREADYRNCFIEADVSCDNPKLRW